MFIIILLSVMLTGVTFVFLTNKNYWLHLVHVDLTLKVWLHLLNLNFMGSYILHANTESRREGGSEREPALVCSFFFFFFLGKEYQSIKHVDVTCHVHFVWSEGWMAEVDLNLSVIMWALNIIKSPGKVVSCICTGAHTISGWAACVCAHPPTQTSW